MSAAAAALKFPTTSTRSGCRSRPTARSRRRRACSRGAKDMHYYTPDGRADPRRHRRPVVRATPATAASQIVAAIQQAGRGAGLSRRRSRSAIRKAFELASRASPTLAPDGLDHVFFTNSGSEAVDTALKIALAYHRVARRGRRARA